MTMGAPSDRKCSQRNRIKYTPEQLERLEKEFGISHYPDTATMEDLAFGLNVSLDRVSIWFQNRRSKFKRQSKDSHVTWMRKQIYVQDTPSCRVVQPKFVSQRHVLSAPTYPVTGRRDLAWQRGPSSNLNYLPSAPVIFDQLFDVHHGQLPPSTGNGCPTSPEMTFYTYPQWSNPGGHSPSQSPPMSSPLTSPPISSPISSPPITSPMTSPPMTSPMTSPPMSSPMTSPLSTHALMLSHLMSEGHQMTVPTSSYQTCAHQTPRPSCVFADHYSPVPLYPA